MFAHTTYTCIREWRKINFIGFWSKHKGRLLRLHAYLYTCKYYCFYFERFHILGKHWAAKSGFLEINMNDELRFLHKILSCVIRVTERTRYSPFCNCYNFHMQFCLIRPFFSSFLYFLFLALFYYSHVHHSSLCSIPMRTLYTTCWALMYIVGEALYLE